MLLRAASSGIWWREAAAPTGSGANNIARALQFRRQHHREPLGVTEIAIGAGLSREQFTRTVVEEIYHLPAAWPRELSEFLPAALLG